MRSLHLYAPRSIKRPLVRILLGLEAATFLAIAWMLWPAGEISVGEAIRDLDATDSPRYNAAVDWWNKSGILTLDHRPTGMEIQRNAVRVLKGYGQVAAPAASRLAARLNHIDKQEIRSASEALIAIGENSVPHVLPVLSDAKGFSKSAALYTLTIIRPFTPTALSALEQTLLSDTNAVQRRLAAYGLGAAISTSPQVVSALLSRAPVETDGETQVLIGAALAKAGRLDVASQLLCKGIHDARYFGDEFTGTFQSWLTTDPSDEFLTHKVLFVGLAALSAIPNNSQNIETLKRVMVSRQGYPRVAAAGALWKQGYNAKEIVLEGLSHVVRSREWFAGGQAVAMLGEMGPAAIDATDLLVPIIKESSHWSICARTALKKINPTVEASIPVKTNSFSQIMLR